MTWLAPWRGGGGRALARALVASPLLLALAALAMAQQMPQPLTSPRAPLGPGSEASRPSEPRPRPRMAPQRSENDLPAGPKARQDHQLELFRGGLASALNRSSATTPPGKGVLMVNTSDGPFAGVVELPTGERRRFRLAPYGQSSLACDDCGERVRLRFHDGYDPRVVDFPHGSRVYVIVHLIYDRFEIISQGETARLARIPP